MVKSKVNPAPARVISYPWIGEDPEEGTIVLFSSRANGVVIAPGDGGTVGQFSDEWDMSMFIEFKGNIILENQPSTVN
jgi:hypothetical protein